MTKSNALFGFWIGSESYKQSKWKCEYVSDSVKMIKYFSFLIPGLSRLYTNQKLYQCLVNFRSKNPNFCALQRLFLNFLPLPLPFFSTSLYSVSQRPNAICPWAPSGDGSEMVSSLRTLSHQPERRESVWNEEGTILPSPGTTQNLPICSPPAPKLSRTHLGEFEIRVIISSFFIQSHKSGRGDSVWNEETVPRISNIS